MRNNTSPLLSIEEDRPYHVKFNSKMNLCSMTLKTNFRFNDDRPFSVGASLYPTYNGLKVDSVISTNNLDSDYLDDPELIFDSNNLYRDESILKTN